MEYTRGNYCCANQRDRRAIFKTIASWRRKWSKEQLQIWSSLKSRSYGALCYMDDRVKIWAVIGTAKLCSDSNSVDQRLHLDNEWTATGKCKWSKCKHICSSDWTILWWVAQTAGRFTHKGNSRLRVALFACKEMALENANSRSVVLSKYSPLHEIQVSSASSSAEKEKSMFSYNWGQKCWDTLSSPNSVEFWEKWEEKSP